eukprot:5159821-Pleurochrysis_carterae.AAC.4
MSRWSVFTAELRSSFKRIQQKSQAGGQRLYASNIAALPIFISEPEASLTYELQSKPIWPAHSIISCRPVESTSRVLNLADRSRRKAGC